MKEELHEQTILMKYKLKKDNNSFKNCSIKMSLRYVILLLVINKQGCKVLKGKTYTTDVVHK